MYCPGLVYRYWGLIFLEEIIRQYLTPVKDAGNYNIAYNQEFTI